MRCLFEEATQKRDALERSVAAFPTTTPLDVLVRRDHVGLRSLFLASRRSMGSYRHPATIRFCPRSYIAPGGARPSKAVGRSHTGS